MNNRIMKTLSLAVGMILSAVFVNAQDQFTNLGNVHVFSGASVAFFGDFANDGTFTDDGGTITFKGSFDQTISGTSPVTFYSFSVNNAAGVSLQQNITVGNLLTLTAGPFDLNAYTLTINNSAATAVARTGGYIVSERVNNSSKVKWNVGSNTTAHVFPFGTASGAYIPFTLQVTSGNIGNVTVSTYPTAANNTPYPSTPVAVTNVNRFASDNSANVVDRFWQIDKDGAGGTATLTFSATASEVGTIATLRAQRWNGAASKWDDPLPGQTSTALGVTVPGVTEFSPWTLSGNSAMLPIELLSFTATPVNDDVDLRWKTATEIDNDYFTVERSADGVLFEGIATVAAGSNPKAVQNYNYVDVNAMAGRSYYRLKQTDFDGKFTYSDVRMVEVDENRKAQLTAFPNPVTNNQFAIDFHHTLESPTSVTVFDLVGKIVYRAVIDQGMSIYTINLDNPPPGVYIVKAFNLQSSFQETVVLK